MVALAMCTLSTVADLLALSQHDKDFKARLGELVEKSEKIARELDSSLSQRNQSFTIEGLGRFHRAVAHAEYLQNADDKLAALRMIQESTAVVAARVLVLIDQLIDLRPRTTIPDANHGIWREEGYASLKAGADDGTEVGLHFPTWQNKDWLGSLSFKNHPGNKNEKMNLSLSSIGSNGDFQREWELAAWDSPKGTKVLRIDRDLGDERRVAWHLGPDSKGRLCSKGIFRKSPFKPADMGPEFRFDGEDLAVDLASSPKDADILKITGVNLGRLLAKASSIQAPDGSPAKVDPTMAV